VHSPLGFQPQLSPFPPSSPVFCFPVFEIYVLRCSVPLSRRYSRIKIFLPRFSLFEPRFLAFSKWLFFPCFPFLPCSRFRLCWFPFFYKHFLLENTFCSVFPLFFGLFFIASCFRKDYRSQSPLFPMVIFCVFFSPGLSLDILIPLDNLFCPAIFDFSVTECDVGFIQFPWPALCRFHVFLYKGVYFPLLSCFFKD